MHGSISPKGQGMRYFKLKAMWSNCGHIDYFYNEYVVNINKKSKYGDFNFRIKTLFII